MANRAIKFRAWDKVKKVMYSAEELGADELTLNPDGRGFVNVHGMSPSLSQYYPHILPLQFTGLRDKNGVEIYEGDILVCSKYIGGNFVETCYERGYVEVIGGAFGLHRKQGFYRPFKDWFDDWEFEVIGNIYENPELVTP